MTDETSALKNKINKMDAARRQLEAAIDMTFDNYDFVATHTLGFVDKRVDG